MGKVIVIVLIAALLWEWEKTKSQTATPVPVTTGKVLLGSRGVPGPHVLRAANVDTGSNFDQFVQTGYWNPGF